MLIAYLASLTVIGLVCVAFLVAMDRRDRRERVERADLLQRIQAPQAAVAEHHQAVTQPVEPGSGLPMTDAQMAELAGGPPAAQGETLERLIAQMEAVENGTAQLQDGLIA